MYNNLKLNYYGINASTSKQDQHAQVWRMVQPANA
jgi:hypothetical protein